MLESPTKPRRHLTLEARNSLVFMLHTCFAAIVIGLLTGTLFHFVHSYFAPTYDLIYLRVTKALAGKTYDLLAFLIRKRFHVNVGSFVTNSPFGAGLLLGLCKGLYCGAALTIAWRRFYPQADEDVLVDIPAPGAIDPLWGPGLEIRIPGDERPIGWVRPAPDSPRDLDWMRLVDFAFKGASYKRVRIIKRPADGSFIPFHWAVLTGIAGTGKTRTAVEFLRRGLARTHEWEPGRERLSWWARCKIRMGEIARRNIPLYTSLNPKHPWDIAWIKPGSADEIRKHARRTAVQHIDSLKAWKPRRPTAFLLDDPKSADAIKVCEALEENRSKYKYPVRLLIANQTLPTEPKLTHDVENGTWFSERTEWPVPVIVLSAQAYFTHPQVTAIGIEFPGLLEVWRKKKLPLTPQLEALYGISSGHPMLVELGIRRLLDGVGLLNATADLIVADRAERVRKALEEALHDERHLADFLKVVASATLAGAADLETFLNPKTDKTRKEDMAARHQKITEYSYVLKMCHNLASRGGVPAVRPELVGDAFVQLILKDEAACDNEPSCQDEVATLAWNFNPDGVIRSVKRRAALPDSLGRILRLPPPPGISVDPKDLALAYATAAIQHAPDRPEVELSIVTIASRYIDELSPAQADEAYKVIAQLINPSLEGTFSVRTAIGAELFFNALERMLVGGTFPGDLSQDLPLITTVNEVIHRWRTSKPNGIHSLCGYDRAVETMAALAASTAATTPPLSSEYQMARAELLENVAWNQRNGRDLSGCFYTAKQIEVIQLSFSPNLCPEQILRHEIKILVYLCSAYSQAGADPIPWCQTITTMIDAIVMKFAGRPYAEWCVLQSEIAHGYLCETYIKAGVTYLAELEAAVAKAEGYAKQFGRTVYAEDFGLYYTQKLGSLSVVLSNAGANYLAQCADTAAKVDSVARRIKSTRFAEEFAFSYMETQSSLCVAYCNAGHEFLSECKQAAAHVEAIAKTLRNGRFAKECEMKRMQSDAGLCVAYSRLECFDLDKCEQASSCFESAFEQLDEESRRDYLLTLRSVRLTLCTAYTNSGPAYISKMKLAVASIDSMAELFRDESQVVSFELDRAKAYSYLSASYANAGPSYLSECESASTEVNIIADKFTKAPETTEFESLRAQVLHYVTYARGQAAVS